MVSYKVEVVPAVGWTSPPNVSKQVQARLDAFAAGGWHLSGIAGIGGTPGFFGGGTNPYLLMVFEHE
jgi:hypothetical protein